MKNYLGLFNLETSIGGAEVRVKDQNGELSTARVLSPKPYSSKVLDYAKPPLSIAKDKYGLVEVVPYLENAFAGKTVRLREVEKEVDFAMPILVK